jgi:hypothetical protein
LDFSGDLRATRNVTDDGVTLVPEMFSQPEFQSLGFGAGL